MGMCSCATNLHVNKEKAPRVFLFFVDFLSVVRPFSETDKSLNSKQERVERDEHRL